MIIAPAEGHGEWFSGGVEVGHLCRATLQTSRSERCFADGTVEAIPQLSAAARGVYLTLDFVTSL